ncbi:MAG: polysaccharide biosynthesis protein, partial [Planctomycetaceae bacterium]|nr:polysaccharide biosynthesis protein [Planctomycetaceae bacterium]
IRNNIGGTRTVVDIAAASGTERFVLISTDKAVSPSSVMGATKLIAEKYVQWVSTRCKTEMVTVRFGNVLNSAGSVVPTFRRQIAQGGPVTVTHPEMTRFFMTIPEAVQLVLQAGAVGCSGDVLILEMGDPVKIFDLARDMIALSGLKYREDIDIVFTGIRPGEKLHEELFYPEEEGTKKVHEKIFRSSRDLSYLQNIQADVARLELSIKDPKVDIGLQLQQVVESHTDSTTPQMRAAA